MKINKYVDISTLEKEAQKDFYDRHSPFIHCESSAKKGEKFKVKVKLGNEYQHPDDFDHYISNVQLWSDQKLLADANFIPGALGNQPSNLEVDFYIVPQRNLRLTATAHCTKHGLWHSDEVEVDVN